MEKAVQVERMQIVHRGRIVSGILYSPKQEGQYPMVIFSHGYNGNKADFAKTANYLAEHGVAGFCYDFCGGSVNGESTMSTTDMTLFTEKEDLEAVIAAMQRLDTTDKENIFLFGASQGGLVTALTAEGLVQEIRGMVLLYPAFCIADDWNKRFPKPEDIPEEEELWGMKLGRVFFESLRGFDVFAHTGKYDRSVLVMHGDQDPIVALGYSEKIAQTYPKVRLEVFEGEGHGFTPQGDERAAHMLLEFVKSELV